LNTSTTVLNRCSAAVCGAREPTGDRALIYEHAQPQGGGGHVGLACGLACALAWSGVVWRGLAWSGVLSSLMMAPATWMQAKDERYIYERDMGWLRECDAVVAEVTQPSLGVGYGKRLPSGSFDKR
jgi:hypothetical protein